MPVYENGPVSINYEDSGSGFPLLILPGGGLSSTIAGLKARDDFNPIEELAGEYRCIVADLRNAPGGRSVGPLEAKRPWDSYADDHLGLMDHLRIDQFLVMGFCIGGPFIWNLMKRAPNRVVAAVMINPNGVRPEAPHLGYDRGKTIWAPDLLAKRQDISPALVEDFLTEMYTARDFVYTVTRDFVGACDTPILFLPDDIPEHPYVVTMEAAILAPRSETSIYPWQEPRERIPLVTRQIRSFLRAHRTPLEQH